MTRRVVPQLRAAAVVRVLTVGSLVLTLLALATAALFLRHTTGGTVFLFSMVAPACVLGAVTIWVGVEIFEFRQRHTLFQVESFAAGRTVFRQGDPADAAYFIRRGEVEVVDEVSGEVLRTLGPGDYFGEIALIADRPRSATIRARSDLELSVVGKQNFLKMMRLIPETEKSILQTVSERVTRGEPTAGD